MGRKRARKKLEKRRGTVLQRLEELARRGADEEFLALAAAELPDPAGGPLAGRWAEVADRALRRALARAEPARLEELLRRLGPAGRRRPLGALAAAVVDLAAGRSEAARTGLAELAADGGLEAEGAGELLSALRALAGDEPLDAAGVPELEEIARLRELAERPPDAGGEASQRPGRPRLTDPFLRATRDLLLALRDLEAAGCEPAADRLATLRRALRKVSKAAPAGDPVLGGLLDGAERTLGLFGDLAKIETRLSGPGRRKPASQTVLEGLRRPGGALASALTEPAPPLLAPLAHALRLRWRALLEAVAEREAAEGLATLAAARPELVAREAGLDGEASGPGIVQARRARALLAGERFEELGKLLRAHAKSDPGASELAALWSVELWAFTRMESSRDDDGFEDVDDLDHEPAEPSAHRALVRLEEMASQIGRRFPAEQRPEVARELRDELFSVCEAIALCDHTGGTAAALLDHLPGDAGLLIAGIAGAITSGDRRCRRDLEARLARRGTLQPSELETARRLMLQVAVELPEHLGPALEALRPLFAEADWAETAELVARKAAPMFGGFLAEASSFWWLDPETPADAADLVRADLELLRPALGATASFAAVELVLDCWRPRRTGVARKVRAFLASHSGYEAAMVAVRVLQPRLGRDLPAGGAAALQQLAEAAVDRLDDRWRRWWRDVPVLALAGSRGSFNKLERRVEGLLADPGLDEQGREILAGVLEVLRRVGTVIEAEADRSRSPRRGRRPTRKRAARTPAAPAHGRRKPKAEEPGQLQLDLDLGGEPGRPPEEEP